MKSGGPLLPTVVTAVAKAAATRASAERLLPPPAVIADGIATQVQLCERGVALQRGG